MNAINVISAVQKGGGSLQVKGGKLIGENVPIIHVDRIKNNKAEIIRLLQTVPVEPRLKPCPLCGGRDFIHGMQGGYFCITCQPNVRPGTPVRAGSVRQ